MCESKESTVNDKQNTMHGKHANKKKPTDLSK